MTSWVDMCDIIYVYFVHQKNVHTLQSAVDSLQKEKEELVLALQSVKKDTNQAKYGPFFFFFWLICFDIKVEHSQKPHSTFLLPSSDTLHLLPGLASSGGRDFRSWRASSPTWRRSFSSSQRCWNSKSPRFRKLASSCRKYRWVVFLFLFYMVIGPLCMFNAVYCCFHSKDDDVSLY